MKIKTKELVAALSAMKPIVKAGNTLPILSCVKLEASGDVLTLSVSNLDEWQTEVVECGDVGKFESVCINFKNLVYATGAGEETILECDGEFVSILPAGVQIGILKAEEFPSEMKLVKPESIGVNCQDLAECVAKVAWARCDRPERYTLCAVHVVGSPKKLYAEATNGYLMSWIEKDLICCDFEICIPEACVPHFCSSLMRDGAILSRDENKFRITYDGGFFVCKGMESLFPNTSNFKPKGNYKNIGAINVAAAKAALQLGLSICGSKDLPNGRFEFGRDGLGFKFNDPKRSAKMDAKITGNFKPAKVGMNIRLAHDILNSFDTPNVDFLIIDELSPVLFNAGELSAILVPTRLS